MKFLLFCPCAAMACLSLSVLALGANLSAENPVTPFKDNSVITGTLKAAPECTPQNTRMNTQVWLSVGQILIYQVEVPIDGNYEFHVRPGKYDLTAMNSIRCIAQTQVTVAPKQVAQIQLRLAQNASSKTEGKTK